MIREARPQLVLIENVPRLLGLHFERLLRDLRDAGYDCEWDCIPAAAVGAPHLRDRLWLLAYRPDDALPTPRAFGRVRRISPLSLADDGVKWPRAGALLSGQVFELEPIAPRKTRRADGKTYWAGVDLLGGGSTSTVNDNKNGRNSTAGRREGSERGHSGTTLSDLAFDGSLDSHRVLIPSPVASDWKGAGMSVQLGTVTAQGLWPTPPSTPGKARAGALIEALSLDQWPMLPTPSATSYGTNQGGAAGRVGQVRHSLESLARNGLLPTPQASHRGDRGRGSVKDGSGGPGTSPKRVGGENLRTTVAKQERGALNPDWVEWLMALPVGWTDVDCETPAYRPFWDEPLSRVIKECPHRRQRLHAIGNSLVWLIPYLILERYKQRCGNLPGEHRPEVDVSVFA